MKQRKKSSAFPFKKELMALVVILSALCILFAVVRAVQKPEGVRAASEDVSVTMTERRTTLPQEIVRSEDEGEQPSQDDKVVYLTFDDGPTSNTNAILDALDRSGVKATFFVIHTHNGCEIQLRDIYTRGHAIGLHSYSHQYEIYRSEEAYFEDLDQISDLVYEATGERSKLLRFPGGSSNTISRKYKAGIMSALTKAVEKKGYVYFDWNWDSMDASNLGKDAASITKYATRPIGQDSHVILLMHDSATKKATVEALPDIIRTYKDAGYRFDVLSTESYVYHHKVNN